MAARTAAHIGGYPKNQKFIETCRVKAEDGLRAFIHAALREGLAEAVRFELTVELPLRQFSRLLP